MNVPAQRSADGRLLPGNTVGIAGAKPRNIVTELKIRYENRIPELMERLFWIATHSDSERTQISAISELLDRLVGKPQVTIDAVTTKVDVAGLYLAAMRRINSEAQSATSHIASSEQVVEGKANAGNSINGSVGTPGD
jgi:hypothetical protein